MFEDEVAIAGALQFRDSCEFVALFL